MLRKTLSYILSVSIVLTSLTSQAGWTRLIPGLGTFSISKMTAAGIKDFRLVKNESGEMVYEFLDDGGSVLRRIAFGKATREQLREFAPSKLQNYFQHMRDHAGAIVVKKVKEFPMEAFSFFVALGAINSSNLIFNYNENPLVMNQFLDSQKSILGQIAFGSFMIANGLTSEPLMAITESKNLRMFIPYLGMSVGMIASNIVHEVGSKVPGLFNCARTQDDKICDAAFDEWTKISLSEKAHEWAPGLFAMMASTVLAGTAEWALKAGVGAIARIVAIEVALSLCPAGWVVRGARWSLKVAQLAGFVYINNMLEAPMVFYWKNAVQIGPQLKLSNGRMGMLMATKLVTDWQEEKAVNPDGYPVCTDTKKDKCFKDLDQEIGYFQETMGKWREANLASVLTAHANWSQFLHQISAEYRVSHQFYFDFVSDMWKKTYQLAPTYRHLMDRSLPLYGVIPKGLKDDEKDHFLLKPTEIQQQQLATIADLTGAIEQHRERLTAVISTLRADEQNTFNSIYDGLKSQDPLKIGDALKLMRFILQKEPALRYATPSQGLTAILDPIFTALGNPNPAMDPGDGYLKIVAADPHNEIYRENPFPSHFRSISTPLATQYLVAQMFLGPDAEKNEPTFVKNLGGWPASFHPPMIRKAGAFRSQTRGGPNNPNSFVADSALFSLNFWVDGQGGGTMFDYLRNNGVRESVLGDKDKNNMKDWWEQHVEKDFSTAWLDYETRYEDIILDFYHKLYRSEADLQNSIETRYNEETANYRGSEEEAHPAMMRAIRYTVARVFTSRGNSVVNISPVSNGVLESLIQERAVYLYTLDSILKSSQSKHATPPTQHRDYSMIETAKVIDASGEEWTKNMLREWKAAQDLLGKIQAKPVRTTEGTKQFIVSRLTNKEMNDQVEKMNKLITEYPIKIETTEGYKKKIMAAAIDGLKKTQEELLNYTQIINNVSYVENFHGEALTQPTKRRCVNAPSARGTQQWLAHQFQGCAQ